MSKYSARAISPMMVKIEKCSGKGWWYQDYVGSSFELVRQLDTGNYIVDSGARHDDGKQALACIAESDGEIV
jgi:hypothetical protein